MKIIAFDASTEAASVALYDGDDPAAAREIFAVEPRAHARRLLPAARSLLAEAGLELAALDGIAFAHGPGAFTGLRIAAGFVQGLALGAELPVVGVSTLAALAARAFAQAPASRRVQVVQDARMGEIYTATFVRATMPRPEAGERVMTPADLELSNEPLTVCAGNGWARVLEARGIGPAAVVVDYPHALDVARLALPVFTAGEGEPAAAAIPVYVRNDVARKPRRGR